MEKSEKKKKGTKTKKKGLTVRSLTIIIVVFVIALLVILFVATKKKPEEEKATPSQTEEFVQVLEDGTKQNTSSKLAVPKRINGLEITNIRLTEKDGLTLLLADVRNIGNKEDGDFAVRIKIVDKEENQLVDAGGYIDLVKPGETVVLNTSVTAKLANAYDFVIEKEE